MGEFENGKPHGNGTTYFKSGAVYVGEWKDGKMHGQGTKYYNDGWYVGEEMKIGMAREIILPEQSLKWN